MGLSSKLKPSENPQQVPSWGDPSLTLSGTTSDGPWDHNSWLGSLSSSWLFPFPGTSRWVLTARKLWQNGRFQCSAQLLVFPFLGTVFIDFGLISLNQLHLTTHHLLALSSCSHTHGHPSTTGLHQKVHQDLLRCIPEDANVAQVGLETTSPKEQEHPLNTQ